MASGYHLTRRFSHLYGAAGIWAVAGGGLLTITSGATVLGALLIGFAIILLALIVTGRIIKERNYTQTDVMFLLIPLIGFVLIFVIYFLVFPLSYIVLAYLAVFVVLSILAFAEARRSTTKDMG